MSNTAILACSECFLKYDEYLDIIFISLSFHFHLRRRISIFKINSSYTSKLLSATVGQKFSSRKIIRLQNLHCYWSLKYLLVIKIYENYFNLDITYM